MAEKVLGVGTDILVVDNDLRTIAIPPSIKSLGVASDDGVLRLKFRLPRYYGEFDLSEFKVRINYLNAMKLGDVYKVADVVIEENAMTFSWLVGRFATVMKGKVHFNVCLKKIVGSGEEAEVEKEFNTTPAILPVLEGLETTEQVVRRYPDLVETWQEELFGRFHGRVDETLSILGHAADAAATGKKFGELVAEMSARFSDLVAEISLKANQTDISSPYNFKGSTTFDSIPRTGNKVNDTYYCTDKKCKYTWNGYGWYQSSLNEGDYENALTEQDAKIERLSDDIATSSSKLFETTPSEVYSISGFTDFSVLTSTITNVAYYCNRVVGTRGYLRGIHVSEGVTSISIVVMHVNPNNEIVVLHDYGWFDAVDGYVTINDDKYLLQHDSEVYVRFAGTFNYLHGIDGVCEINSDFTFKARPTQVTVAYYLEISDYTFDEYNIDEKIDSKVGDVSKSITRIDEMIKKQYKKIYSSDFVNGISEYTNKGWDLHDDGYMVPGDVGGFVDTTLINYFRLNKEYACDKRVMRAKVSLFQDTVMNIHGIRYDGNFGEGDSLYQVDVENGLMKMYKSGNNYRGVLLDTVSASTAISITNGREYIVELEQDNYTFYFRLIDTITTDVTECSVVGWDAGRQLDHYAFTLQSGTPYHLHSVDVYAMNRPKVMFMGDSITEGVGMSSLTGDNTFANRWAEIMRQKIGNCMLSGEGGCTIDNILQRVESEVAMVTPDYVVVTIGTNGGASTNTLEKFERLVARLKAIGVTPIINHISYYGNDNRSVEVNTIIDQLDRSVIGCMFDVATAVDYDLDKGCDGSLFIGDNCHPNHKGSARMVSRFHVDCPELLFNLNN